MRKPVLYSALLLSTMVAIIGFNANAIAKDEHSNHSGHSSSSMAMGNMPTEPGQSAFAAIAEIVQILEEDANTDWSKVDITALRSHLVDMEMLTTAAAVTAVQTQKQIVFEVSGSAATLDAAKRMVPAHSAELKKSFGWNIKAKVEENRVQMIVISSKDLTIEKIKALGFFGIMATGTHHQLHHLAIARGDMVH